jgi:hypothetical protein
MILAPTLTLNTLARGYDADATAFAAASGATDVSNLSAFVKGVKELGLWSNMVCWPLRSSQNAGTGTTAYSLGGLGTFNGTLTNGPTWGSNGITITASAIITDGLGAPTFPTSFVVAGRRVAGTGNAVWEYISSGTNRSFVKRMYANNSAGIAISAVGYIVLVDAAALTLTDNFEVVTGIVPSATNSETEYLVNATKPAQTAGGASWGAGASTGGVFRSSGDGQFEASMHAVFTAVVPASFYTLYKTTLGTGLSLP